MIQCEQAVADHAEKTGRKLQLNQTRAASPSVGGRNNKKINNWECTNADCW